MFGHFVLLEACEVNESSFFGRVAQKAVGMSASLVGCGDECGIGIAVTAGFEPISESQLGGRIVSAQRLFPGVEVEPLAGVLAAGMDASEVVWEGVEEMPADFFEVGAEVLAIGAVGDAGVVNRFVFVIDHAIFGVFCEPPTGGIGTDSWDEQDFGIDRDDLPAEIVQGRPIEGGFGWRPAVGGGEGDQMDARVAREGNLTEEGPGWAADVVP